MNDDNNATATATTTERDDQATVIDGPRIYVASLSDYNSGTLHGRWIDAARDESAIHADITAMLAESSEPGAEEWAIHDFEGFGKWKPREYEAIATVSSVACLIVEHGEVFSGLMDHCSDIEEATRYMEDGYRGEWNSVTEYVEDFMDEVYSGELKGLPDLIRWHIDYDGIARDFELSGDIFTIECGGKVHVFDSHI